MKRDFITPKPAIMSVYAYIRVSTEMQCQRNQEEEIRKYCNRKEITVDRWVSESVSGTISVEKRLLGKTIRRMRKGDLLICTELSRLGRNMLMIMGILNQCSQRGISIRTIKDNFVLTDNINSKIIAFAFALAAEIERNLISQRTKEALSIKKLEGIRLGRPPGASKKKEAFMERIESVTEMHNSGKTLTHIAQKLGIHRNTARRYLVEMGICAKK